MKLNWPFIFKDLKFVACFVVAIVDWNGNAFSRNLFIALGFYFLVKQLYDHYMFYKETKRIY